MVVRYVQVDSERDGQRLDNLLLGELKGAPRSLIYRLLRTGQVRVNQGRAKPDYRVCNGDRIRIPPIRLAPEPTSKSPPLGRLRQFETTILYEDPRLLVINKPAGVAVHGGSGVSHGVIEIVRAMRPQAPTLELVHRLDRDTSGCLLLAKRRSTLRWLHQLIRAGALEKRYLALLVGRWEHATLEVNVPLRKQSLQGGERVVRVDATGKPSRTGFHRLRQFAATTLVEARLYTGRTHQIRVHAAYLGNPVAGDDKYGDREANTALRAPGLRRLFLHASTLTFPRADGQGHFQVTAPLDPQLELVLQHLSSTS